jgi:PAS domain S-box-containing protein
MDEREDSESIRVRSEALERVSDGIVALDDDLRYTYVNNRAERLLDQDRETLLGTHVLDAFPAIEGTEAHDGIERALDTNETVTYERYNAALERWFEVRVYPDDSGVSIVFSDVTERKTSEQELERTNRQLEALVRNTDEAIYIKDLEGTYRLLSATAADLFDLDVDEAIGKRDADLFDSESASDIQDVDEEILESGSSVSGEAVRFIDGERHVFLDNKFPYHDESGEIVGIMGISRDITERKEREHELERAETLFRNAQDAFFLVDVGKDGKNDDHTFEFDRVNPAYERLTDLSTDSLAGKTPREVFGDEEGAEVVDRYRECVDRREPIEYEEELSVPESGSVWETRIAPVVIEDEVVQLVGSTRNITERKRRERELKRYRAFVENTSDAITIIDTDGTIDYASPATAAVFGHESSDLVGTPAVEHVHPDDREEAMESLEQLLDDPEGRVTQRYRFENPDGSWIWIESTGVNAVGNPAIGGVLLVSRDVSEPKKREQRLERTLKRIQSLFRGETKSEIATTAMEISRNVLSIPFTGVHLETDGRLEPTAVSDAVTGHFGEGPTYRRSDGDRSVDRVVWDVYESGEQFVVTDVHENDRIAPEETPVESLLIYPLEDHGVFIAAAPVVDAFTDVDRILFEMVATNLTVALDRMRHQRQLEEQRDGLELLNQMMSHDIRNDLQLISAYSQSLSEYVDEGGQDSLETIIASAERAIDLTGSARHLAEAMLKTDVTREPVPLRSVLEAQLEETRRSHDVASVIVDGTIPRVGVMADDMLASVFRNLLKNGIQHNDRDVPEVVVSVETDAESVRIRIADDGPGVADERKDEIFGRGSKGLDSDGTGIGLYLVRTLVEQYDGSVHVEDVHPTGAAFVVELERA